MAEVLLFHHIQGLTDGVQAFAGELRQAGHTVHTPDLFEGRTFGSLEEGMSFARETGFDTLRARGVAAADGLSPELVYGGFSFGVTIAQKLAQTRPGARGALLMHSCIPVTEFGTSWPDGVPVQLHGKEGDEFFEEDLPAARELAKSASAAELFTYPGDQHLFTDASLDAFDADASKLLMERVRTFLAAI
ncbi:dienelactone hydrolase family protein [Streptomyces sp. NPDC090052]|uniref:dienelactone hydrolase family protein n=1 Tax=unclassified Streptomyces TaxID=2593676 RepID=UPI002251F2FC|nr:MULTISPECIES: dienelactone hydrolase family protein [unclassified Streptomyces]MCX4728909.1 dienelactone hydrolase family protein [Streptomyces sp. NBC_01306]WSV08285.1 dienelactone hydrolase family protein [Streptomyces sp. NBC_01020]WSX46373.1 dienelactone hydrolase family protein [Streptomyces sp. NBC_00963]WSX65558.1 dienelactone hydrolase family protein [Streptomyces sp. NBC_00932]